ncbi:MAG: AraC family transcriptional regulator [Selenomonadaceae bacterium]|nr:AraC family transcriptional regulator [Selenomonadaceae bacterium]
MLKYVAEHYIEKISFAELAANAHISRTYLSARFKEEVGISFSEYLS